MTLLDLERRAPTTAPWATDDSLPPPVTVVIPAHNERKYIVDCLHCICRQDYPAIVEILVVDGMSDDGTREIVRRWGDRVRLVDNSGRTAAAAMNRGLAEATSEIVVRVDAHTHYTVDYVSRSVEVLIESGADWVGGPMRPAGVSSFGRAVAAVTSSPLGVGPGRFHYATTAADVDTVYLGTFRRSVVVEVGGYDDRQLQWAAEDQELNFRLRQAGHRIRLDPRIRSTYFPRQSPGALWRQYFNYGMCKASTLAKHKTLPYWRPLAPAAMVAGAVVVVVAGLAGGRRALVMAPIVGYGTAATAAAVALSNDPGVAPHRALAALSICHWSYGLGFWAGVSRIVRRRRFDSRPGGR